MYIAMCDVIGSRYVCLIRVQLQACRHYEHCINTLGNTNNNYIH